MGGYSAERPAWLGWASGGALFVGACSLAVYFFTLPADGPAHSGVLWSLMIVPFFSGIVGLVFGVLARSWGLIAVNLVLVFPFPLVMFLGTLLLGP